MQVIHIFVQSVRGVPYHFIAGGSPGVISLLRQVQKSVPLPMRHFSWRFFSGKMYSFMRGWGGFSNFLLHGALLRAAESGFPAA
eukprot:6474607-Amphidinium_carterae.1